MNSCLSWVARPPGRATRPTRTARLSRFRLCPKGAGSRVGRTVATPHTLLELYSQVRIQLPTLPLFTFQRPDITPMRSAEFGMRNERHRHRRRLSFTPHSALRIPRWLARAKFAAADEQERVEQETAGERGAGPAAPHGRRLPLPYSPALLSPAHLLYAAGGGVVEPKGFEPMTSWLQTRRSPG